MIQAQDAVELLKNTAAKAQEELAARQTANANSKCAGTASQESTAFMNGSLTPVSASLVSSAAFRLQAHCTDGAQVLCRVPALWLYARCSILPGLLHHAAPDGFYHLVNQRSMRLPVCPTRVLVDCMASQQPACCSGADHVMHQKGC